MGHTSTHLKHLTVLFLALSPLVSFAQQANNWSVLDLPVHYSITSNAGARIAQTAAATIPLGYTPENVSKFLGRYQDLGNTGTRLRPDDPDNGNTAAAAIGFTFRFRKTNYTQFILNTNGFIKLGALFPSRADLYFTGPQSYEGGALYSNSPIDSNLIVPFNHNLGTGTTGAADYRVATTGVAPNRICIIQWKNVRDLDAGQFNRIDFQIRLYETSNQIEFVYGKFGPNTADGIFKSAGVGLRGINTTQSLFGSKFSGTGWQDTQFFLNETTGSPANINQHNFRNTFLPDSGWTYQFGALVDNNMGVRQLYNIPQSTCGLTSTDSVSVVYTNAGTRRQTNIPVGLKLDGRLYTRTLTASEPGQADTITFRGLDLSRPGKHVLKAFTALTGDALPRNDTLKPDTILNIIPRQVTGDTNSFETNASLFGYKVFDRNNDANTWGLYEDPAYARHGSRFLLYRNQGARANDWIISSCYQLDSVRRYKVSFSYRTLSLNARQNLSLWVFNKQVPDTNNGFRIFRDLNFNYSQYKDTSFIFNNVTAGSKYFGIWIHSAPNAQLLVFDDLVFARVRTSDSTFVGTSREVANLPLTAIPNPAKGSFVLASLGPNTKAHLYDSQGRLATTTQGNQPITHLRPGLYMALAPDGRRCRVMVE